MGGVGSFKDPSGKKGIVLSLISLAIPVLVPGPTFLSLFHPFFFIFFEHCGSSPVFRADEPLCAASVVPV